MAHRGTNARYECNGTAALAERRAYLTLIEGGRGAEKAPDAAAPREVRPAAVAGSQVRAGLVTALLVAALVLVASVSDALTRRAIASAIEAAPTSTVTVHSGDTLWSIAAECGVEGVSTRDLVSWIIEENGLEGGLIMPGQVLVVPVSS